MKSYTEAELQKMSIPELIFVRDQAQGRSTPFQDTGHIMSALKGELIAQILKLQADKQE
jgi:hypothetical protein